MRLLHELTTLAAGQSFWRVRLSTGRIMSELGTVHDLRRGTTRHMEWLEDLIGSGDIARVREVTLCTPRGDVHLVVEEPYTAFQFSQGMVSLEGRRKSAQVVGVVTDKAIGACEYAVWDVAMQQVYTGTTSVYSFEAWRPGVVPFGALNLAALDVRL